MATQVFLQPAASKTARRHFRDTIVNPVSADRIRRFLREEQEAALSSLLETAALRVWGVAPGERGAGSTKWNRLRDGDIGLFAREWKYFAKCRLLGKVRNPDLARNLWPRLEGGETWENVYFVSSLSSIDIPYLEFNKAVGYDENKIPQGFEVLDAAKSAAAIAAFKLPSS